MHELGTGICQLAIGVVSIHNRDSDTNEQEYNNMGGNLIRFTVMNIFLFGFHQPLELNPHVRLLP